MSFDECSTCVFNYTCKRTDKYKVQGCLSRVARIIQNPTDLVPPNKFRINIDISKCKKKGNPGEQCGCQCLWMCTDKGNDKENPLPPRFIKCIFLDF